MHPLASICCLIGAIASGCVGLGVLVLLAAIRLSNIPADKPDDDVMGGGA